MTGAIRIVSITENPEGITMIYGDSFRVFLFVWSADDYVFFEIEFQMAGGRVITMLGAVDMPIESDDVGFPVVIHGVSMDYESGALESAADAEEPGGIAGQFRIYGIASETQLAFMQFSVSVGPDLQGLAADLGLIGGEGPSAYGDADIALKRIAAGRFIIGGLIG